MKNRFRIGKINISITNPEHAISKILCAVTKKENQYICVSNPRTVVIANHDIVYQNVMNNSYMNLPDAEPIIWAAKLWGLNFVKRTMGPLLFSRFLDDENLKVRHFLLGDTNQTLDKIVSLKNQNRDIKSENTIVGHYSPPFCSLEDYDYVDIAKKINESNADIVWLALRAPKQDFFVVQLLPHLDGKICIGVGAAFRFYIGEYKLANPFIRKLGLMGLFWGKKEQTFMAFLKGYFRDNLPFLRLLGGILLSRVTNEKYYN